jgi:hypothetical protein
MMQGMTEKDRRALRFGGIGVGVILVLLFAVLPVLEYWDGLGKKVSDAQKKLRAVETGVQQAATDSMAMRDLRERVTFHPDPAGLNRQTALLLEQVEKLPSYRRLRVERLEGLPLREDAPLYRSGVSVQFAGTLEDLHRVLAEMEGAKPALKVERLTMTTGRADSGRVEGQMVVVGYAVSATRGGSG